MKNFKSCWCCEHKDDINDQPECAECHLIPDRFDKNVLLPSNHSCMI